MTTPSTTVVGSSNEDEKKETSSEVTPQDASYSNLEVDWTRHTSDLEVDGSRHFSDLEAVRHGHSDLEVNPAHGHSEGILSGNLQAYHPGVAGLGHSQGPIPGPLGPGKDAEGPQAIENYGKEVAENAPKGRKTILGVRKSYFWAGIAVVTLLIIAGAVGAGVGATRHKSSSGSNSGSSSSGSGSGSSTTSGGSAPSSTTTVNTGIKRGSSLASLAWTVTESRYQYRVYYQDDDNAIKESAFDSMSGSWRVTTIVDGRDVLPDTSIATTSSKQSSADSDTVVCFSSFIHRFILTSYSL